MIKLILKALLFFGILFSLFYPLEKQMDKKVIHYSCYKPYWVLNNADAAYKYGFLGTSRVYNMLDVDVLEKLTNEKCINLGMSGTGFIEQYLMLYLFYKEGKKLDELYLEVNPDGLKMQETHRIHYFLPFINNPEVGQTIKEAFTKKYYLWKYIPYFKYAEYNIHFPIKGLWKTPENCIMDFDDHGSDLKSIETNAFDASKIYYSSFVVEAEVFNCLKKIISLARNNNTKVHFYTAPFYTPLISDMNTFKIRLNVYDTLARNENIKYTHFEASFPEKKHYLDAMHLNRNGCRLFSEMIVSEILLQDLTGRSLN